MEQETMVKAEEMFEEALNLLSKDLDYVVQAVRRKAGDIKKKLIHLLECIRECAYYHRRVDTRTRLEFASLIRTVASDLGISLGSYCFVL